MIDYLRFIRWYIHLRWQRPFWSWIICNIAERQYRKTELPVVSSVHDVRDALKQIEWTPDKYVDYVSSPQKVWATKSGDCEDISRVASELLAAIGIRAQTLNVITVPVKYSHAVTVFGWGIGKWYFDNAHLKSLNAAQARKTELVVAVVADGMKVVCWTLNDGRTGKFIRGGKA